MRIDISAIDKDSFMVHEHIVNGELMYLVQPQRINVDWQQENKVFRSSLWSAEGELISAGMPKFVDWGQLPDQFPVPSSLKNTTIVSKIDGSLLIVSKHNGHHILRTRGTVDATKLENGYELVVFKETILPILDEYASKFTQDANNWGFSYLFEWTSPINRIVISYSDSPQWYLIGQVFHNDYTLQIQYVLDRMAKDMGLMRPEVFSFPTIEEMITGVVKWQGKEGIVTYAADGQSMWRCKSEWYLKLHRFKEHATLENTIDMFFSLGKPSYQVFEQKITETFDHECFCMVRGFASNICDAWKYVNERMIVGFNVFIRDVLKPLPTRREQADKVLSSYGQSGRSGMIFTMLDSRPLSTDQEKKLLYQVLAQK
jgi:hypothetical protein